MRILIGMLYGMLLQGLMIKDGAPSFVFLIPNCVLMSTKVFGVFNSLALLREKMNLLTGLPHGVTRMQLCRNMESYEGLMASVQNVDLNLRPIR